MRWLVILFVLGGGYLVLTQNTDLARKYGLSSRGGAGVSSYTGSSSRAGGAITKAGANILK